MSRDKAIQVTLTIFRVIVGFMFFQEGTTKLFGWFGGMPGGAGNAQLMSQMGVAGLLETVGGIMILAGFLTRPTAFILCGEMAVAYFQAHQPKGTWPVQNGGQPAVLYCFVFLFLSAMGAGIYSLDAVVFKHKA